MVRVYNDNVHPYSEKFNGQNINIPPKGFIEMDFYDANLFLGTMPGNLEVDASGIQKPTSYKMLRIQKEWSSEPQTEVKKYICHACNKDLLTKSAYESHIEEFHLDDFADKETKEAIVKKRGRPAKGVKDDTSANRNGSETQV